MLARHDGTSFCTGRSRFYDRGEGSVTRDPKIFIKIEPYSFGSPILGQLDTGATWSILNTEVARELSLLGGAGQPAKISTRVGEFHGWLERTQIDIIADEGQSLNFEATFFVSPDWPLDTFIGYSGLLDHVRFAVDPSDNSFYFSSV